MTRVHGFLPIANPSATRLILGSMPGKVALAAHQYYAHPRNYFWPIMETILGVPLSASYEKRCQTVIERGVAIWDVLKTCARASSLDSDIVESSIVPNDFGTFLSAHLNVRTIFFNGSKAAQTYKRYVYPALPDQFAAIRTITLPSTSPANASISLDVKLRRWEEIRE